ncbi:MAG: ArnT family glycosyltransferase [Anaerolineae bacterium]
MKQLTRPAHRELALMTAVILLAFALRVWRLDGVPPGWRDDELINSLVISQKALDGNLALYYPDASGHEALYHLLNAVTLALFGLNKFGIRALSAFIGTLTVPMTYALGRRLFGERVGITAAAGLALSFWSLMYSRIGLRHVLMPLLVLMAFYTFWRGWTASQRRGSAYLMTAVFMGLGFYTYFASRGMPLILIAFCGYLWLFARRTFLRQWRRLALMFGVTLLLALPLLITLGQQPESEARVAELAVPLVEAREGNFAPLWRHLRVTLSMFHADGDDEWLYNLPHRPVFGFIGAIFFWVGVATALWYALKPVISRFTFHVSRSSPPSLAAAFLLLWWLAGISPGFISVPPASLGHTIVAQPATFILAALPLHALQKGIISDRRRQFAFLAALLLVTSIGRRDLPAYFREWPERGMVRFLYHADMRDVAHFLAERPELTDFGISGLLAGPWDKLALTIDLGPERAAAVRPRWYNPERAIFLKPPLSFSGFPDVPSPYAAAFEPEPGVQGIGGYTLSRVNRPLEAKHPVCFRDGLCWLTAVYDPARQRLELGWLAERIPDLPPMPLISNPPPPGVYAGPRLLVFSQLLDSSGEFLVGDDGLWVDPATLQAGDIFLQQHFLAAPPGADAATVLFGLYDPMTGERILTEDGRDHLELSVENAPD